MRRFLKTRIESKNSASFRWGSFSLEFNGVACGRKGLDSVSYVFFSPVLYSCTDKTPTCLVSVSDVLIQSSVSISLRFNLAAGWHRSFSKYCRYVHREGFRPENTEDFSFELGGTVCFGSGVSV